MKYPNEETVLRDRVADKTCKSMLKNALFTGAKVAMLPDSNWMFYKDKYSAKLTKWLWNYKCT